MEEGLIQSPDYPIRLPIFEGPLDLLLFLIRKNEVDIYDIPIASVTEQYLAVLHQMETLNLEVAGDFFVMAATLMYIKSRMLLPRKEQGPALHEEDDEDIDPRWELVQQLLEYRRVKEASALLHDLIESAHNLIPRNPPKNQNEFQERPLHGVGRIELWNTFNQVLRRLTERMVVGEIHDEVISVSERMESILEQLKSLPSFTFSSLFPERPSLALVVASFLALLELARLNQIEVEQEDNFADIRCARPAGFTA